MNDGSVDSGAGLEPAVLGLQPRAFPFGYPEIQTDKVFVRLILR